MDKTLENIKLISEFQGLDYSDVIGMCKSEAYDAGYRDAVIIDNPAYWSCYHNSWDWLMPVVKKCLIGEAEINRPDLVSNIYESLVNLEISLVYKDIIEFIKWYNQQK